jgi:hypothetical protein
MRCHTAIYWKKVGVNEFGRPTFSVPVLIGCRWDSWSPQTDVGETQDNASNPMVVFPDRVLEVGGYLMMGDAETLKSVTQTPPEIPNAFMIKSQKIVPRWKYKHLPITSDTRNDHIMIEVTL